MTTPKGVHTAAIQYRYQSQLTALPNCPAAANASFSGVVYRAVYGDKAVPRESFLPYAVKHPDFYAAATPATKCKHWSLSMYEKKEQLLDMIERMKKNSKNYQQLVGDHCATLKLSAKDGHRTKAASTGHFSFYEFDSWSPQDSILSTEPIL